MGNRVFVRWFLSLTVLQLAQTDDEIFLGDNIYYAINCGGRAHTDLYGVQYQADSLSVGTASDYGVRLSIHGVDPHDAILYQTERYHTGDLTYTIPLPKEDGEYTLVLKFCEVYFRSSRQKVFDVLLNGEVIIADLDIYKEAGGAGVAYDYLITFFVKDGVMTYEEQHDESGQIKITFAKGASDNPKINAFYIYRGPKTDIPALQEVVFDREMEELIVDDWDDEPHGDGFRFDDEPFVDDPYAVQDTSHVFLPFLIAFACFFPILFCLCKM